MGLLGKTIVFVGKTMVFVELQAPNTIIDLFGVPLDPAGPCVYFRDSIKPAKGKP